jgi:hypothetical protein
MRSLPFVACAYPRPIAWIDSTAASSTPMTRMEAALGLGRRAA